MFYMDGSLVVGTLYLWPRIKTKLEGSYLIRDYKG